VCASADSAQNLAKELGKPKCPVGNPCNPATGVKVEFETDYVGSGAFPLRFERSYDSSTVSSLGGALGPQWGHNYSASVQYDASLGTAATVIQADGRALVFDRSARHGLPTRM
jgi:hypothetical protein